jgi:uncharacterized repeat protein (TIGR01451 family)
MSKNYRLTILRHVQYNLSYLYVTKFNTVKKSFTLIAFLLCLTSLKAQFVTIPDANFVAWLQTNVPSAMNGNQMDTTNLAVTTRTIVDVYYKWISNLDGIQYFKSLKKLECSTNNITNLNNLPSTLIYLNCDYNQLTSIPVLPNLLETLICSNNELTSLPILPNTLKTLVCNKTFPPFLVSIPNLPTQLDSLEINGHGLSSLPLLPLGLKKLSYSKNLIVNLPILPNTLLYLNCSVNSISGPISALPSSLIKLNCSSNSITSLPSLPTNLKELLCGVNNMTTLPNLPTTLEYLDCGSNNISALPTLPNQLKTLYSNSNSLTSLPTLPVNLTNLDCSTNQLNSLPLLPNTLGSLNFSYNQVSSFPNMPTSIWNLKFNSNLITNLPALPINTYILEFDNNQVSSISYLPNSLISLHCSTNQLISLPLLPPHLQELLCASNNINCFPSFPSSILYFVLNNNPFTCLPNHSPFMDAATLAYPLCTSTNTITNPNNCNSFEGIEGAIYNDVDSNCIFNNYPIVNNIPLKLYDNNNTFIANTYAFLNARYNFALASGNYKVVIDTLDRPYKVICSNPGIDSTVALNAITPRISNVNFAINCKPGFDIGVQSIVTNGLVFPGQTHTLTLMAGDMYKWYNMNCSNGISGMLTFTVNGPVTYIAPTVGALMPTVNENVFTYTISDFSTLNNSTAFQLIFQTDTTAQANDIICINANITPTIGDNAASNNTYQDCYSVINSYDPNIKEVYPIDVTPGFNDWLTYTIHFQNTGNAPAINIRLADTLDNMLNLETFQVINYSHYNQINLIGNTLNVSFPNIQLPDSSSNSSGSIGFIQYRLKPKSTWAAPYKIKNTAYIYFDYNAPIVTNTTYNSILIPTGINNQKETLATLFPNPTNGIFTIELSTKEKQHLQLFDIAGNLVLSQIIENGKVNIDANHLAAGIYNISIKGNSSVTNKKLVIVK